MNRVEPTLRIANGKRMPAISTAGANKKYGMSPRLRVISAVAITVVTGAGSGPIFAQSVGGAGGYGWNSADGGATFSAVNSGKGGEQGASGAYGAVGFAADGGAGGAGTTVQPNGDVIGNAGVDAPNTDVGTYIGGGGGGGGAAAFSGSGTQLSAVGGNLIGGSGGRGSSTYDATTGAGYNVGGGGGGAGGDGADIASGNAVVNPGARIAGGTGGSGGNAAFIDYQGHPWGGYGGNGGDGGVGVHLPGGSSLFNEGTVSGGQGGLGGTTFDKSTGAVVRTQPAGAGGVGILAESGSSIVNAGTIVGGMSGDTTNATQAPAIRFLGGASSLELRAGSVISGNVDATAGANNALILGGTADSGFDLSQIGSAAQYRGFSIFRKTGTGLWTLTGRSA